MHAPKRVHGLGARGTCRRRSNSTCWPNGVSSNVRVARKPAFSKVPARPGCPRRLRPSQRARLAAPGPGPRPAQWPMARRRTRPRRARRFDVDIDRLGRQVEQARLVEFRARGVLPHHQPDRPPALTPARALARGQCAAGGGVHWHPAISVNSDEELGLQYLAGSILRLTRVRGGINDWYQGGYSDPARKAVDYPPEITVERQLLEVPKSRCRSKADIAPFSRMTSAMASSMPLMHRRASSSGMQNCRYPDRYRCTAA